MNMHPYPERAERVQRVSLTNGNWIAIFALLVGQMVPIVGTGVALLIRQAVQEVRVQTLEQQMIAVGKILDNIPRPSMKD